jgi:hypothetical protein
LRAFDRRIHCEHCRAHWRAIVRAHPPDFASAHSYFVWTVRAHNAVNRLLGKPIVSVARASSLWRRQPLTLT